MEDIIAELKVKNELMEAFIEGEDVSRLLEISYRYTDKSIAVFDCSSRIVAMVGQDKVKASNFGPGLYIIDHGYSTGQRDHLEDFKEMTQWIIDSADPRINDNWGVPRLNCRIQVNGEFAGHITIQADDRPFSNLDFEIESLLRTLIEKIWAKEKLDHRDKSAVFLKSIYDGAYINRREVLLAEMEYAGIPAANSYAVLHMQQRNDKESTIPMRVIVSHFSTYIYSNTGVEVSYYLVDDCGTCLLSTRENRITKDEAEVITEFLEINSCYGGLSGSFTDLNDFREYCNQAEKLSQLVKDNPDISLATFKNSFWEYLVCCLGQNVKIDTLVCSPIQRLVAYDKEHNSELLDSYIAYVESGNNVSLAANELFVHRNTMNRRIRKIADVLECSIENIPADSSLLASAKIAQQART